MKMTGFVRRIDDLSRLVVPKELRRVAGLLEGDPVEFYMDGKDIIIRKYDSAGLTKPEVDDMLHKYGEELIANNKEVAPITLMRRVLDEFDGQYLTKKQLAELFLTEIDKMYPEGFDE